MLNPAEKGLDTHTRDTLKPVCLCYSDKRRSFPPHLALNQTTEVRYVLSIYLRTRVQRFGD
jgi:hypothetical protein